LEIKKSLSPKKKDRKVENSKLINVIGKKEQICVKTNASSKELKKISSKKLHEELVSNVKTVNIKLNELISSSSKKQDLGTVKIKKQFKEIPFTTKMSSSTQEIIDIKKKPFKLEINLDNRLDNTEDIIKKILKNEF